MNNLNDDYDVYIDDIISSFREISNFIGKSSENKSHVQRSTEIVNVTSTTIKSSKSEHQIVLQKLINSLSQLYNLSTSNKSLKLVLKSLDKLIIFGKIYDINSDSITCILNLLKRIYNECNNDSELLKLMQIILNLSFPNSLLYHVNSLFQQSFNLLCLIGKKLDDLKTKEIVIAALENLLLQLASHYRAKVTTVENGTSESEIILHSLLYDIMNLINNKDVVFIELSIPTALDFILLIVDNLTLECLVNDGKMNDILLEILFYGEVLIDNSRAISKYILVVNSIFKLLPTIASEFVDKSINLCNKNNDELYIIFLLMCLLSSNHTGLRAEDQPSIQLLNYFTNTIYKIKYNVSDLYISSLDVMSVINEIDHQVKNISKLLNDGTLESQMNNYICIICLEGIISIMLKYHNEKVSLHNSKQIFHIFTSSEQPTRLIYSSLNILYSISSDKQYIMEFVCNRALYDEASIYPLECVHNIFKQTDLSNLDLLQIPIRTLIRVIYNIVENYNNESTLEELHLLINKSIFGHIINQFISTLENHVSRPNVIKMLHECYTSTNLFKKKFGIEIFLFFIKAGSLDEIIQSLDMLSLNDPKIYSYATSRYFEDLNSKIDQSTSSPIIQDSDWEKLSKLHFSPDVLNIITKFLDEKLVFLTPNDWHNIISTLGKFTTSSHEIDSTKVIQILEQIIDDGDFDIKSATPSLFESIRNCCKKFSHSNNYSSNMDNEGFILVGIIWKIADLIGKDGITNEEHWWYVLESFIQLSNESSIAIKICSMRSLSSTIVTYWRLFQSLLPLFFNEWYKVIQYIKTHDEIVDQQSVFEMFVHETLQVIKVVEFEKKNKFLNEFVDVISTCDIEILIELLKYSSNENQIDAYNKTLNHFIVKSTEYLNDKNSYICGKIADAALFILGSKLNCNHVLISLIYIVVLNNRSLKTECIIKKNQDYYKVWLDHLENLVASIKSDVSYSKTDKMAETLSNLNYKDASKYIISNYNSVLNAVSLSMLESVLDSANVYRVNANCSIRDFANSICMLKFHISNESFNSILDIISQCFSTCSPVLIQVLVQVMQQMVCENKIGWMDLLYPFINLINQGLFRVDLQLLYIDKISQVLRLLLITKHSIPHELLLCIHSISSKDIEFTSEAIIIHLVLINLLEMSLATELELGNKNQLIYEILDIYADNSNIEYNVISRLFNDSQDPNPNYSAFITLITRIKKSLSEGNLFLIYGILPMIHRHKISQPELIGLDHHVFQIFKPNCIIPCILTDLKIANHIHNDKILNETYHSAVSLAMDRLTEGLNLDKISSNFN